MFGRVRTGAVPVSALLAALALCLWLAGCSGGSGGAGADGRCRGGKPFSTVSPAYKGAGPHRMIGFQLGSHDGQKWDAPDAPELPGTWAADRSDAQGVAQTFGDDALESRLRGLVEGSAVSR